MAVGCRVFIGLEEGACKTADKGGGEIGIGRQRGQGHQEGKAGGFHGRKRTKPLLFVRLKNPEPPAQLGQCDREAFAELLHGGKTDEILRQDAEDEEQAIAGIRDDEIRNNGMGMAAGADEPQDAEAMADRGAAYEVNEGASVVGMGNRNFSLRGDRKAGRQVGQGQKSGGWKNR